VTTSIRTRAGAPARVPFADRNASAIGSLAAVTASASAADTLHDIHPAGPSCTITSAACMTVATSQHTATALMIAGAGASEHSRVHAASSLPARESPVAWRHPAASDATAPPTMPLPSTRLSSEALSQVSSPESWRVAAVAVRVLQRQPDAARRHAAAAPRPRAPHTMLSAIQG
jgi:hypothetical protein